MFKRLLIFCVLTVVSSAGYSAKTIDGPYPVKINLLLEQESFLVIYGETNIHDFQCNYSNLRKDTLNITAYWEDNCLMFDEAEINLETKSFDCGNRQMNIDLQNLLKAGEYPHIVIDIECIDVSKGSDGILLPVKNNPGIFTVLANISIADEQQQQRIPVEILKKENERDYTGSILINLKEFNLEPPTKMMGLVKVDETIEVHFFIKISLIESGISVR